MSKLSLNRPRHEGKKSKHHVYKLLSRDVVAGQKNESRLDADFLADLKSHKRKARQGGGHK